MKGTYYEYQRRYSGSGRSGLCTCGHSWEDHHLGLVLNEDYRQATGEIYFPQECEFDQFEGISGPDDCGCQRYRDALLELNWKESNLP